RVVGAALIQVPSRGRRAPPAASTFELRAGWAFAAEARIRACDRASLRRDAAVGDVSRPVQDLALIGPDEAGAAAAVEGDRDRVGEVAVPVVEGAEDPVRADP